MGNGKSISIHIPDIEVYNDLVEDVKRIGGKNTISSVAYEIIRNHYHHQQVCRPGTTLVYHQQETVAIHRHLPQPPAPPDAPVQVDAQKKG